MRHWNTLRAAEAEALVRLALAPLDLLLHPDSTWGHWLWLYQSGNALGVPFSITGWLLGSAAAFSVPTALICAIHNLFVRKEPRISTPLN